MNIKAYQVNNGDCFIVKDKSINIVIDSGFYSTYDETLENEINDITERKECINCFIVSHIHRDHISGVKKLFAKKHYNHVHQFVFNNPFHSIQMNDNTEISFREGTTFAGLLKCKSIPCKSNVVAGDIIQINDNISLDILSPNKPFLDEYLVKWANTISPKYAGSRVCDWTEPFEDLFHIADKADSSKDNRASIAFILNDGDSRLMFLGDSHCDVISESLRNLGYSKNNKLNLDLVKLSHHGSINNISSELMELINCTSFLISSNGNNLDKATIAKIRYNIDLSKTVCFYFNYQISKYSGILSDEELYKYRIECKYADNKNNYILIIL